MATESSGDPEHVLEQFREYRRNQNRRLRNKLVEQHLELVDFYVNRYKKGNASEDDVRQQAFIGLIGAVERFDPDMGVSFRTFANRTVEGELKRHLRDSGWAIRPPRSLQELHLLIRRSEGELVQRLGRHPTAAELAQELDESTDRILEAMAASGTFSLDSLDRPMTPDGATPDVPITARGMGDVEQQMLVDKLLADADERDREVLILRFYEGLSQTEIADRLGVSQSYLSRVLRNALAKMRERIEDPDVH